MVNGCRRCFSKGEKGDNGWAKWLRQWTGEEKPSRRCIKQIFIPSGRVNMREVEITTQHLINDGFDPGTDRDPYKNFVFTSFQRISYVCFTQSLVAQMAKKFGDKNYSKCVI